jgi:mono/diheme cytochrome c family protein
MKARITVRFGRRWRAGNALASRGWVVLALLGLAGQPAGAQTPEAAVDFAQAILPIFNRQCVSCHGPKTQKGSLRLDSKAELLRGGDSGKVVVPGDPVSSPLLLRLTTPDEDTRMPLGKAPLSREQIDRIRRWIEQGTPGQDAAPAAARSDHWSFQPIRRPDVPPVQNTAWVRNPIDHFILARLEQEGVAPAPEADRQTLLRRLSLDLIGLPPAPEEVAAFVADPRPDAYERLVDRLLASPHFGERFGNHWLDLARYGDSDGFEQDAQRLHAYRWRDWVIAAVNSDLPFDQFTIEQLAGDLLPQATPQQLLATGFHRNAPTNREGGIDKEEARVRTLVERVSTTGTVWLGLTVGCAECHSHKFDPLRQTEFYQLYAFFNDAVDEADLPLTPTPAELAQYEVDKAAYAQRLQSLRDQLARAQPEQREGLERTLSRLQRRAPTPPQPILAVFGPAAKPRQTYVHKGGDYRQPGAQVPPGTPAVLPPLSPRHGSGQPADRLDLARWLVDPAHPLPARVEANRLWQYLFGTGLVTPPDDFGTQGDPPAHPQLLDHLAWRLIDQGWSRKALVRHLVTSSTYRQASRHRPELESADPNNRWLARQNRFRLPAEIVRDVYLAAAGLLNRRIGGPGMRPEVPPGFADFAYRFNWTADPAPERYRRGMYIFFQRNMVFPMLRTFDRSDSNLTCVRRERSNTPLQALTQLNDPEFVEAAAALGRRLVREAPASQGARIERAFRLCYGRPAAAHERDYVARLWQEFADHFRKHAQEAVELVGAGDDLPAPRPDTAAWIAVARVLMNTDEFVTRE